VAIHVAESFVGKTIKVLVEKKARQEELERARVLSWEHGLLRDKSEIAPLLEGRYVSARGEADAPDIDGRIYVRGDLAPGEFATVKIIGHTDYDLLAEPA
jgi:ribosomal protein S12 methylthiotransferase